MSGISLNTKIQHFYDQSTPIWLKIWGEHMHHGHYGKDGTKDLSRVEAQIVMINTLLSWGKVEKAEHILDAGCGVGGSSRFLAKKFNASVLGLTLSPIQKMHADRYSVSAGLDNQVRIEARDMMSLNSEDRHFDLIWSMESAEHIQDKQGMFDLFFERSKVDGTVVMATWCHRELTTPLNKKEALLLEKICEVYHLPPMKSITDISIMAQQSGFREVSSDDWSDAVEPFWQSVIDTALTWQGVSGLIQSGFSTIKAAWAMRYMKRGFKMGLIKYGVLSCKK